MIDGWERERDYKVIIILVLEKKKNGMFMIYNVENYVMGRVGLV